MQFGIMFANIGPMAHAEGAVALAQAAEENGFESLWTVEHTVVPAGYQSAYPYSDDGRMPGPEDSDIPDPLIWLTYVAAHTRTIRLGTGILILPQRNPVVLAKEVATLDRLSGGRVELGVGVGWLEEEFDAIGVPFADRGKRTDDHIEALRALWTQDRPTHHGPYASFHNAISRPQPTQGSVPIHVGGHSPAAARRAGRLGDGFFPGRGSHEELAELIDLARRTAVEHGRHPDDLVITAGGAGAVGAGALDEVKALADLGVSRVVIWPLAFDPEGQRRAFGRYGEEVIARC
ncbi:MAG TPA: TIGR03619 family F420-dependent LLM class oxidoreductase [Acidimicrobiales bacterium]|jgi:probable F420-dependent oxidoreductase|nr:TIGR03619 family F420-dependent LLM class oxidoreductase [Acidimicrobiales bacterium]